MGLFLGRIEIVYRVGTQDKIASNRQYSLRIWSGDFLDLRGDELSNIEEEEEEKSPDHRMSGWAFCFCFCLLPKHYAEKRQINS